MADDDLIPAWRTVVELAETGVSAEWTLVGGLMVAAHARRAGLVMRRPLCRGSDYADDGGGSLVGGGFSVGEVGIIW